MSDSNKKPKLHSSSMHVLICGFKGTGKDSLFKGLSSRKFCIEPFTGELAPTSRWDSQWIVLTNPNRPEIRESFLQFGYSGGILRVAFADKLKEETHKYLKLKNCAADSFDDVKESMYVADPENPQVLKTIREWYIWYGAKLKRDIRDTIWVDFCMEQINEIIYDKKISACVTDWRFKIEKNASKSKHGKDPLTIRVYRPEVKEAPLNVESEHDLDDEMTDVLLIAPGSQDATFARFPQYARAEFKPCDFLTLFSNR